MTPADLQSIAIAWSQADPISTFEWLESIDAAQTGYDNALYLAVNYWAKQDIDAAAQYVQALPVGPARDGASVNLIRTANRLDPHTALEWSATSATLSDSELRQEHLVNSDIAIDTFATHPDEAKEAIADLQITDEEKVGLLDALEISF